MQLHLLLLPVIVLLILTMVLRSPFHWILLADLLFVVFPGNWSVGGVDFDPSDIVLAGIAARLLWRRRERRHVLGRRVPYLKIWILIGVLMSISYLTVPITQGHLTDPLRITYQLYRYCWKPILYYPLAFLLLSDLRRIKSALLMVVLASDLCALLAMPEGLAGVRATGPFRSGNALGAALMPSLLICVASFFSQTTRARFLFFLLSLALLGRAFLYSGSRGAFAGLVVAAAWLVWRTFKSRGLRPRLRRLVVIAAIGTLGLLLIKPDLFERPTVSRMLSTTRGVEESTLKWRMEERWPHFWNIALEHPWLGTGRVVDPTLGTAATGHTPHNGYLALAVKYGFPVLTLYLLISVLAFRDGLRSISDQRDPSRQLLGTLTSACLAGLLIHNVVDSLFVVPFTLDLYWMLVAMAAMVARTSARGGLARSSPGRAPRLKAAT